MPKTIEDLRFMRATDRTWAAIREAQIHCHRLGHAKLTPLHLLYGLLSEKAETPIFNGLLEAAGITKPQIRVMLDAKLDDVTATTQPLTGERLAQLEISQVTYEACEKAYEDGVANNRDVGTGTCNLLVGILHVLEHTDPATTEWFAIKGVTAKTVSVCYAWTLQHLPNVPTLRLFFDSLAATNANPTTIIVHKQEGLGFQAYVEGKPTLSGDWLSNEYSAIGDLLIRHGGKLGVRVRLPAR
jgi:hypothetical protein